jgi:hypothetical protein
MNKTVRITSLSIYTGSFHRVFAHIGLGARAPTRNRRFLISHTFVSNRVKSGFIHTTVGITAGLTLFHRSFTHRGLGARATMVSGRFLISHTSVGERVNFIEFLHIKAWELERPG